MEKIEKFINRSWSGTEREALFILCYDILTEPEIQNNIRELLNDYEKFMEVLDTFIDDNALLFNPIYVKKNIISLLHQLWKLSGSNLEDLQKNIEIIYPKID